MDNKAKKQPEKNSQSLSTSSGTGREEEIQEEGQELCPDCGNLMVQEGNENVCSSCSDDIDFLGEDEKGDNKKE